MLFVGSESCSSACLLGFAGIFVVAIRVEHCQNADINQALLEVFWGWGIQCAEPLFIRQISLPYHVIRRAVPT
jgi:hypothetical protein